MYYTIYKITNQINGKFYVGSHKTEDLDDNYMGSGKYLKYAQEKYGVENFTKEILFVFETPEEMYAKEAEIVDEKFLSEENTYNLKIGGFGGWDFINSNGLNKPKTEEAKCRILEGAKSGGLRCKELGMGIHKFTQEQRSLMATENNKKFYANGGKSCFVYLNYDEQFRKKINDKLKEIGHQQGKKNSQYGKMWIYNKNTHESIRISKSDPIPDGWEAGRKMRALNSIENTNAPVD